MEKDFKNFRKILPDLKENVLLKNHTTFKIGGPAKYFYIAKTSQDLIKAVKTAKQNNLQFFILGGGSKMLISDKGFNGLIIKINNNGTRLNLVPKISAEAGVKLSDLIHLCLKQSLSGLEWAAGIPGATIGGAIRGNAGAFGETMSNIVVQVRAFNCLTSGLAQFNNSECEFDYRNSIFKKNPDLIIISADLKLEKTNKPFVHTQQEVKQKIKQVFDYRKNHHPMNFPSAGSIFVNPEGQSAGSLIEQCGLKGKQIGNAQISEKHANFIINLGNASANHVIQLIELAKKQVKKKFNIELKEEIQYLGF